jgi:hypothetical protein
MPRVDTECSIPAMVLAKLRGFAQPFWKSRSPSKLLRAGIVFHARGLVNAKAIQHNLDWVWPYWVERQFNPADRRSSRERSPSATSI